MYFLTEFYRTKHGVDKIPASAGTDVLKMVQNIVDYYNAHQKSIVTIKCLPNWLEKKKEDDDDTNDDLDPTDWQNPIHRIPTPEIRNVNLGDFNPKMIPIPGISIVIPSGGSDGDDSTTLVVENTVTREPGDPSGPPEIVTKIKRIVVDLSKPYDPDTNLVHVINIPQPPPPAPYNPVHNPRQFTSTDQ